MKVKIILSSMLMIIGLNTYAQKPTNQKKSGEKATKSDGNATSYGNSSNTQENPKVATGNPKDAFLDQSKKSQKDPKRKARHKK